MHCKAEHALVLKVAKPELNLDFLLKELRLFPIRFLPLYMTEVKKRKRYFPQLSTHSYSWTYINRRVSACIFMMHRERHYFVVFYSIYTQCLSQYRC